MSRNVESASITGTTYVPYLTLKSSLPQNKLTALMMASGKGYAPMVRELLRRGAAVDMTDKVCIRFLHDYHAEYKAHG